jgi:hypothetical protein
VACAAETYVHMYSEVAGAHYLITASRMSKTTTQSAMIGPMVVIQLQPKTRMNHQPTALCFSTKVALHSRTRQRIYAVCSIGGRCCPRSHIQLSCLSPLPTQFATMVSSSDTAITLYQALSHLREQLQIQNSELESTLPRKGKNRATDHDAELETQRRLTLDNIEHCLSTVPQMAEAAGDNKKSTPPATLVWNDAKAAYFALSSTASDEEPYLNPFTDEFVYPESTSKFRPGPSGTQKNDDAKVGANPPARHHPQPALMVPASSNPLAEAPRGFALDNRSAIWNGGGAGPYPWFPVPHQPPSETSGHDIIMQGYEAPAPTISFVTATGAPVTPNHDRKAKQRADPTTATSWGRFLGLRGGSVKRSDVEEIQGLAPGPAVAELDARSLNTTDPAARDIPVVATNRRNKPARLKKHVQAKNATVPSPPGQFGSIAV